MRAVTAATLLTGLLLAAATPFAYAYTNPDQIQKLEVLKAQLAARGPIWAGNLASWTCPTPPATTTANETCDPCGKAQWWGNWQYMGCRGETGLKQLDILGGNGLVTNIHFTDFGGEGPTLPVREFCIFGPQLKEFNIAGQGTAALPMGGPLPPELGSCFPRVNDYKFSFNQLTGPLPAFMANATLVQFMKIRGNKLTGTIPPEIGTMPLLYYLDLADNQMEGPIPMTFQNSDTFGILTVANMKMSGDLYALSGTTQMLLTELANNAGLCGMVPGTVRYARGYNPTGTNLGKPCPGATYPPVFPPAK